MMAMSDRDRLDKFTGTPADFEFRAPPRKLLAQAVRHDNGDLTIVNYAGDKTRLDFRSDLWHTYRQWLADDGIELRDA